MVNDVINVYNFYHIFSDVYKKRVGDDTARELRFKSLIEEFCVHLFGKKKSLKL